MARQLIAVGKKKGSAFLVLGSEKKLKAEGCVIRVNWVTWVT